MDYVISWLFRFCAYAGFGIVLETIVTGSSSLISKGFKMLKRIIMKKDNNIVITKQDEIMQGNISLLMIPVYGFLILFVYESVFTIIYSYHIVIRFFIWALCITGFEAVSGWFYDKALHLRLWDYRGKFGSILNGYTRWILFIPWGICGLILEFYSDIMVKLSPYACKIILGKF